SSARKATRAREVVKLTPASTTPSWARRAFSTRAAQAPQAIPPMLSSTVSVLVAFSGGAAIVWAGRTGWGAAAIGSCPSVDGSGGQIWQQICPNSRISCRRGSRRRSGGAVTGLGDGGADRLPGHLAGGRHRLGSRGDLDGGHPR